MIAVATGTTTSCRRTSATVMALLVFALVEHRFECCASAEPPEVTPSASYVHESDGQGGSPWAALASGREPSGSADRSIGRFTFWSHRGTREWVQFTFAEPTKVSSVEVYWFDDGPGGGCRVPQSWSVQQQSGYGWLPVEATSPIEVRKDAWNRVAFKPVVTTAIRLRIELQPGFSSGLLQWNVNGQPPQMVGVGVAGAAEMEPPVTQLPKLRLALAALQQVAGKDKSQVDAEVERLDRLAGRLAAIAAATANDRPRQLQDALAELRAVEQRHDTEQIVARLHHEHPAASLRLMTQLDWLAQDIKSVPAASFLPLASQVIEQLGDGAGRLPQRRRELLRAAAPPHDPRWMQLYHDACVERRAARLTPHLPRLARIVFTKHHDIGGQHYAYTEDVSDSPYNDNNPFPHSGQLCLLEMDGLFGRVRVRLDEPDGLIRDPDVSYDGRRVLFARRTSMTDDDYHLYEWNTDDDSIRQLTFGKGAADYEGVYLPNGHIVFNSSRCQQIVDCWWSDVSNLYTCDGDGRFLRRLTFDQVHTNYPQVLPSGLVVYTRWDYNDRGQLYPQPLFQMNPDGTGQTEYYGNNSWFPTTILHARGIPGTSKVLCVLSGHHTYQKGKLAVIDRTRGTQEAGGVQLVAPVRHTEAVKVDMYGYQGEQFQYPFPLDETDFLITFSTEGSKQGRAAAEKPFGVYWMNLDGHRELLVADPAISCNQAVPLAPRPLPSVLAARSDWRKTHGTYYVQDIYQGPGLHGIQRGAIKRLRIVALEFRAAGVGAGRNSGPAGGALVSTPISINGAWDVKRVLGHARVFADGSAAFRVPARTPVYFQALDDNNHVVQTMRSWSTLQPGEAYSCVGCHEHKATAPVVQHAMTEALRAGPQPLEPIPGGDGGFSFPRLVQPILDRHCVQCHNRELVAAKKSTLSLQGDGEFDSRARKTWSDAYRALADRKFVDWVSPQSAPPMLPPYAAGAAKSKLIALLAAGHEDVRLSRGEMDVLACWIDLAVPFAGEYTEGMRPEDVEKYKVYADRRRRWAEQDAENIEALIREGRSNSPD